MSTMLYARQDVCPAVEALLFVIDRYFDHSWLLAELPQPIFSGMDMNELKSEMRSISSYGAMGSQLPFIIEKLENLNKALSAVQVPSIRNRLRQRGELSLRKELILNALSENNRRLHLSIQELKSAAA